MENVTSGPEHYRQASRILQQLAPGGTVAEGVSAEAVAFSSSLLALTAAVARFGISKFVGEDGNDVTEWLMLLDPHLGQDAKNDEARETHHDDDISFVADAPF